MSVKRFLHNAGKLIGRILHSDVAHQLESMLLGRLWPLVLDAVSFAQASGGDKRKVAFDKAVSDAKAAGISFKDSAVNFLIELAVLKMKGVFGQ